MESLTVTQLNIYPVKSCRGIGVTSMAVSDWGPEWDRRLMLIDENGRFVTARKYPRLLSVIVGLGINGLTFSCAGQESMSVSLDNLEVADKTINSLVWRDQVDACEVDEAASQWFSELLGLSVRLVYIPESGFRQVDRQFFDNKQRVGFADGFPFLLTHQASLDDLSQRLQSSISMRRFRPNIVVEGGKPWAEDDWSSLKIGSLNFIAVKPCSRCVMTTIDPDTLEKAKEPLNTLSQFRKTKMGVIFGQNLVHLDNGIIQVGDKVEVLS